MKNIPCKKTKKMKEEEKNRPRKRKRRRIGQRGREEREEGGKGGGHSFVFNSKCIRSKTESNHPAPYHLPHPSFFPFHLIGFVRGIELKGDTEREYCHMESQNRTSK